MSVFSPLRNANEICCQHDVMRGLNVCLIYIELRKLRAERVELARKCKGEIMKRREMVGVA